VVVEASAVAAVSVVAAPEVVAAIEFFRAVAPVCRNWLVSPGGIAVL
jgi:hypothetical protein